ncbi:hypothetical protein [Colwellia sp. MB3u-4]|uniref:hypothetical protein n=1 Tax=Colwellia sp. MB3u-4 TaxID=2759822 RepID=UPI0015F68332|nr:hypothetical protein [Colwellia sp. MB3u-4]MBA6287768.1 hypothetical protein [Colwellia sp. MB3u-4]
MSNNLIEQFTFGQINTIKNHPNGELYCKHHNIDFNEFFDAYHKKLNAIIDNSDYHIVYKNSYYNESLNSFISFNLQPASGYIDFKTTPYEGFIDSAIMFSEKGNISYLSAIKYLYSNTYGFEVYETFTTLFDELKNFESGKEIILQAITEQYLLIENSDTQLSFDNFINDVFSDPIYINRTREFFIENYNIEEINSSEDLNDILLSCYQEANQFESQIIEYSDNYNMSDVNINELQNDLVQDTPFEHLSNGIKEDTTPKKNKLKKGF